MRDLTYGAKETISIQSLDEWREERKQKSNEEGRDPKSKNMNTEGGYPTAFQPDG